MLKRLKEIVFEQLGKSVVCFSLHFDTGYIVGSSNICFSQSDDIKMKLAKVQKHGYCLWSKVTIYCVKRQSIVLDDSDDDTYEPPKRKKSVLVERIKIANALLEEHGSTYHQC